MKKKALFFDFDGTIVDSFHPTLDAYALYAPEYGFPSLDESLLTFLRTSSTSKIIKRMGLKALKLPFLVRSIRSELRKRMSEINLHEKVDEIIAQLAEEYQIYVVSSNSKKFITEYFNQEKSRYLVSHIKGIYCYTAAFGKARLLNRVLNQINLKANEVIYIGDEVRDIEACRQIGLPIISVSWGFSKRKGLAEHNNLIADKPEQIYQLIREINESL